jgi:hypothetical protein
MFLFKLGLLTCAFYVVLTALLGSALWAFLYRGGGFAVSLTKHSFWGTGLFFGLIFGTLWLISFSAAWFIVYQDLKRIFPTVTN